MDSFLHYVYTIHSSKDFVKLFDKMYVYLNDDDFTECTYHVNELKSITFPEFIMEHQMPMKHPN